APGQYVAFLDDDDLVSADWAEQFRRGAESADGRVIRSISADRTIVRADGMQLPMPYLTAGGLRVVHARFFDLLEHINENRTPICSFAVPMDPVRTLNIRFDDDLPVLEDWKFLMELAVLCGVH